MAEFAAVLRASARPGGAVLLAKRVEDGLFGGLWEPPRLAAAAPLLAAAPAAPQTLTLQAGGDYLLHTRVQDSASFHGDFHGWSVRGPYWSRDNGMLDARPCPLRPKPLRESVA